MNKHIITQLKSNYMAFMCTLWAQGMLDVLSKRGVLYVFKDSNLYLLHCFLFAVPADFFIAFVLVHSFAAWSLGTLDETFRAMHHSDSKDCVMTFDDSNNFLSDPTLLVIHCKFPILECGNKAVVLTIAGHQEASSWQGRHRIRALRAGLLPIPIIIFCQS